MEHRAYLKSLEDHTYLPSINEILQKSKEGLGRLLLDDSSIKLEYEITTKELVEGLVNHLGSSYAHREKTKILEVCAGRGKLAYQNSRLLKELFGNKFEYYAIDNKEESRDAEAPMVESMDISDGINKYLPDIILCSWLPMHPYTLFPKQFIERYSELFNIGYNKLNDTEKIEFVKMDRLWQEKRAGDDETALRRKLNYLKEYILIGLPEVTSDKKAFGFTEIDGFKKNELPITTINHQDVYCGEIDDSFPSKVFSFKRV